MPSIWASTICRSPRIRMICWSEMPMRRAIRALSLAIVAPSLATAETIKVPMTAEQWQPKMPRPRLSSLGERVFRKG
jgi:hypothetical protein